MAKKPNIDEINALLDLLNDRFCDPYTEVTTVNITLKVLGYDGYFYFNEKTGRVTWRVKKIKNDK